MHDYPSRIPSPVQSRGRCVALTYVDDVDERPAAGFWLHFPPGYRDDRNNRSYRTTTTICMKAGVFCFILWHTRPCVRVPQINRCAPRMHRRATCACTKSLARVRVTNHVCEPWHFSPKNEVHFWARFLRHEMMAAMWLKHSRRRFEPSFRSALWGGCGSKMWFTRLRISICVQREKYQLQPWLSTQTM